MPKFYDYVIAQFLGKRTRLGDLAYDLDRDPSFPRDADDKQTIKYYLMLHGACDDCMRTFDAAWRSYRNMLRRQGQAASR